MIEPLLQDDAFLEDVRQAAAQPEKLHLWWLGQSGFLIRWRSSHLIVDPYLSDALTRKYAGTEKPHVRLTARVVAPERLDFIDVAASTHNHTDHLDGETLIPLLNANPDLTVIVPRANLAFAAARLQTTPQRLTGIRVDADPLVFGPFSFQAIPSAHETLDLDENGDYRCIGYIIRVGPWTLYHSGDAVPYAGLVERLRRWSIDVALLPINGRDPARGVPGNFTGEEAARLGKDIHAGLVIPCHYEMFAFNTVSPEGFVASAQAIGQAYRLLRAGQRLSL